MMDEIKRMIGRKVFVVLKSNRKYSGVIRNVVENNFVTITDKFNENVMFAISEISSIEEEK